MEYKDYYKTLGVAKTASADEIKNSFRKLALKYHPDRNPGDKQAEDKFKEMNEAYQVLSDPDKRKRYDQMGSAYFNYQQGGGQPSGFDWSQWASQGGGGGYGGQQVDLNDLFGSGGGGFSDFFSAFFGGGAAGMGGEAFSRQRRQNYEQAVSISLNEAYKGSTRILETSSKKLEVKIPAGSKTGTKIRVPGGGPEGGDIYLKIQVADDALFTREGNDLYTTAQVDVFTAILGGEAEVTTLGGRVKLTIPASTQHDQKFRLHGRGMPHLRSPQTFGDLYVQVKVQVPKELTPEQLNLIKQARDLTS